MEEVIAIAVGVVLATLILFLIRKLVYPGLPFFPQTATF